LSSWLSSEAISPTVARRAVACRRSCAGARQLLDPALLADVQKRAHPAGLFAPGIDQRRLDDEHRKTRAVLAHEDGFEALARRRVAGQADGLALLVFVGQLGRPVGRGRAPEQFLRRLKPTISQNAGLT
jgi:hypothetical protein